jgi:hypothetical protein
MVAIKGEGELCCRYTMAESQMKKVDENFLRWKKWQKGEFK